MLKHIALSSLTIALAAMAVMFLFSGCGGGGAPKPMLRGVANIHSNATKPRIGLLYDGGSSFATYSSASIPVSSNDWQDVKWSIPLPPSGVRSLYAICVFDDANSNHIYSSNELLGFAEKNGAYLYLKDNGDGTFRIYDSNRNTWFENATECTGKDVFIDCYWKSAATTRGIPTPKSGSETQTSLVESVLGELRKLSGQ
ncbi:MAG: hypothetical protein WC227_03505 [Patescibacteria group bacterium]